MSGLNALRDSFQGSILGAAIGDALGMPAESLNRNEIQKLYGQINNFHPSPLGDLQAGEWTDDTEQMIILAESLIDMVYFDPRDFAEKLKEHARTSFNIRTGPTTRQALYNLIRGVPWEKAGVDSATCGAAMRVAPIGLLYHFNLDLVENYAALSASITHKNEVAMGGAVSVAIAIACILTDFSDGEVLKEVTGRVRKFDDLIADKIEFAYDVKDKDIDFVIDRIGTSILTWDVVPMAFYCYFSSEDFEKAVSKGANAGGDADSIAAITGAMAGARYGEKSIPERWKRKLKDADYLIKIADRLYEHHCKITSLSKE
jgi:ADP-ribosylglycohydrolase